MDDPALKFYENLTTLSFTLLGLWFVVLGFADNRWRTDPRQYRTTLHVALHFFLPGMMGLGSVLAGPNDVIWRVTFGVFGVIGLVESVAFLRGPYAPFTRTVRTLRVLDPILYVLVLAGVADFARGAALTPLQVEGILIGLVFMVGMTYLWATFAGQPFPGWPPGNPPPPGNPAPPGHPGPGPGVEQPPGVPPGPLPPPPVPADATTRVPGVPPPASGPAGPPWGPPAPPYPGSS